MARAVLRTAQERGIDVPLAAGFRAIPGPGVEAEIGGHRWMVGVPNLVRRVDARPSAALEQFAREAAGRGPSTVIVAVNAQLLRRAVA